MKIFTVKHNITGRLKTVTFRHVRYSDVGIRLGFFLHPPILQMRWLWLPRCGEAPLPGEDGWHHQHAMTTK